MTILGFTDGAARGNPGEGGIGIVLKDESGNVITEIKKYLGKVTNNVAEYSALIAALQEATRLGAEQVYINTDSQLMSEQVNGNYRVRNAHIRPLYEQAMQLLTAFQYYSIDHIPRSLNSEADDLANQALNKLQKP